VWIVLRDDRGVWARVEEFEGGVVVVMVPVCV